MNLPGFTAEASAYKSTAMYTGRRTGGPTVSASGVAPQACLCSPCINVPTPGRVCLNVPVLGKQCIKVPTPGRLKLCGCASLLSPIPSLKVARC
jgi:hypothetical protein